MSKKKSIAIGLLFFQSTSGLASTYKITKEIPTLAEVSTFLYGTKKRFKKIAIANHLKAPYRLEIGQTLILPDENILSTEKGYQALYHSWRDQALGKLGHAKENKTQDVSLPSQAKSDAIPVIAAPPITSEVDLKPTTDTSITPEVPEDLVTTNSGKSAQEELEIAKEFLDNSKPKEALVHIQKARKLDPNAIAIRITEIRALKMLNKPREVKQATRELLQAQPNLSNLPMFQN